VGFVGRFSPEKGLDTLIKSVSLLSDDCVLVLVGSGPEEVKLKAMVDRLGLSARVRWVPWVESSEVPEYMNAFDVLVLPSRTRRNIKEQFGRMLIEAMGCETCVVGSDSGEIPQVIGNAGLVFAEGNEQELAERLQRLMDDPALCQSLRRRGRQRVLEKFTYFRIAERTVGFYRNITSGVGEMDTSALVSCSEAEMSEGPPSLIS